MAQLQTYPRKTTYDANDLILICDKTPDANGVVTNDTKTTTISTIADNLNVVESLNSLKGDLSITAGAKIAVTPSGSNIQISTSAVDGSGTLNKIPKWSDSDTLTDSIITEDPNAPSVNISGSLLIVGSSNYISVAAIQDGSGEVGSANQVLTAGSSGSSLTWVNKTSIGDTYTLQAEAKSGTSVPLKLDAASGTDSTVNLTEGTGITLTRNSSNEITIASTGSGGTTSTANGGTGISLSTTTAFSTLMGNGGNSFSQSTDVETGLQLPAGNTARRPTASSDNAGLIRYNTETANFEVLKQTTQSSGTYSWYAITGLTIISG
jgi:hypothetical protein